MGKPAILMLLYFLWWGMLNLFAQDDAVIRAIIRSNDLRKLEKAGLIEAEAGRIMVLAVQDSAQPTGRAYRKFIKASGLYEKSNKIKFSVFRQYIDEFWKTHEGEEMEYLQARLLEEQASNHFFTAAGNRLEAGMIRGNAKIDLLRKADSLESKSIRNQITALSVYHGITVSETPIQLPVEPKNIDTVMKGTLMMDSIPIETPVDETLPDLLFRVQIAAGKLPLTAEQLHEIYAGDLPVEMIVEEDWYKYQLEGVESYSMALEMLHIVSVKGAFIAAYENGIKIKLAEAVRRTVENQITPPE